MKLKNKIHLFSTLLMLLILIITNVGIYLIYSQNTYETELQQLRAESEILVHALSQMTGIYKSCYDFTCLFSSKWCCKNCKHFR